MSAAQREVLGARWVCGRDLHIFQRWITLCTKVEVTVKINQQTAGQLGLGSYIDTVTFTNTTDHDGDTTRRAELAVVVAKFALDSDPGWAKQGKWAFGQPQGLGGEHGYPDPEAGATGANVYGVNLRGDYETAAGGPYYLQTGAINLGETVNRRLRFKRWLNTDRAPYAEATLEASRTGLVWTQLWSNGEDAITDADWTTQTYDLSTAIGDGTKVYVRWGFRIGTGAWAYSGWNIDDVEFLADPR